MSINERVHALRMNLKLSQTDFGSKIGLTQRAVSWLEKDGNTVTEQNIHLICQVFGVSEQWLCNGTGDMYAGNQRKSELIMWAEQVDQEGDTFAHRLANVLSQLDTSEWQTLERVFDRIATRSDDKPDEPTIDEKVEAYRQELLAQAKARSAYKTTSESTFTGKNA